MLQRYLTQLILSYAHKYLRDISASLDISLWGGDVVLNNLDLRLDVIQKELNIPPTFRFSRGFVKELRIHIPWTALTTKPVEVTLSQVECVIRFRSDGVYEPDTSAEHESEAVKLAREAAAAAAVAARGGSAGAADLKQNATLTALEAAESKHSASASAAASSGGGGGGWASDLISRIICNLSVRIENLHVTYVEDDRIRLALRIAELTLTSTDGGGTPKYAELIGPFKLLNKTCEIRGLSLSLGLLPSLASLASSPFKPPPTPLSAAVSSLPVSALPYAASPALVGSLTAAQLRMYEASTENEDDVIIKELNVTIRLRVFVTKLMALSSDQSNAHSATASVPHSSSFASRAGSGTARTPTGSGLSPRGDDPRAALSAALAEQDESSATDTPDASGGWAALCLCPDGTAGATLTVDIAVASPLVLYLSAHQMNLISAIIKSKRRLDDATSSAPAAAKPTPNAGATSKAAAAAAGSALQISIPPHDSKMAKAVNATATAASDSDGFPLLGLEASRSVRELRAAQIRAEKDAQLKRTPGSSRTLTDLAAASKKRGLFSMLWEFVTEDGDSEIDRERTAEQQRINFLTTKYRHLIPTESLRVAATIPALAINFTNPRSTAQSGATHTSASSAGAGLTFGFSEFGGSASDGLRAGAGASAGGAFGSYSPFQSSAAGSFGSSASHESSSASYQRLRSLTSTIFMSFHATDISLLASAPLIDPASNAIGGSSAASSTASPSLSASGTPTGSEPTTPIAAASSSTSTGSGTSSLARSNSSSKLSSAPGSAASSASPAAAAAADAESAADSTDSIASSAPPTFSFEVGTIWLVDETSEENRIVVMCGSSARVNASFAFAPPATTHSSAAAAAPTSSVPASVSSVPNAPRVKPFPISFALTQPSLTAFTLPQAAVPSTPQRPIASSSHNRVPSLPPPGHDRTGSNADSVLAIDTERGVSVYRTTTFNAARRTHENVTDIAVGSICAIFDLNGRGSSLLLTHASAFFAPLIALAGADEKDAPAAAFGRAPVASTGTKGPVTAAVAVAAHRSRSLPWSLRVQFRSIIAAMRLTEISEWRFDPLILAPANSVVLELSALRVCHNWKTFDLPSSPASASATSDASSAASASRAGGAATESVTAVAPGFGLIIEGVGVESAWIGFRQIVHYTYPNAHSVWYDKLQSAAPPPVRTSAGPIVPPSPSPATAAAVSATPTRAGNSGASIFLPHRISTTKPISVVPPSAAHTPSKSSQPTPALVTPLLATATATPTPRAGSISDADATRIERERLAKQKEESERDEQAADGSGERRAGGVGLGGIKLFELLDVHANLRLPPVPTRSSILFHLLNSFLHTPPKTKAGSTAAAAAAVSGSNSAEFTIYVGAASGALSIRYVHFMFLAGVCTLAFLEKHALMPELAGLPQLLLQLRPHAAASAAANSSPFAAASSVLIDKRFISALFRCSLRHVHISVRSCALIDSTASAPAPVSTAARAAQLLTSRAGVGCGEIWASASIGSFVASVERDQHKRFLVLAPFGVAGSAPSAGPQVPAAAGSGSASAATASGDQKSSAPSSAPASQLFSTSIHTRTETVLWAFTSLGLPAALFNLPSGGSAASGPTASTPIAVPSSFSLQLASIAIIWDSVWIDSTLMIADLLNNIQLSVRHFFATRPVRQPLMPAAAPAAFGSAAATATTASTPATPSRPPFTPSTSKLRLYPLTSTASSAPGSFVITPTAATITANGMALSSGSTAAAGAAGAVDKLAIVASIIKHFETNVCIEALSICVPFNDQFHLRRHSSYWQHRSVCPLVISLPQIRIFSPSIFAIHSGAVAAPAPASAATATAAAREFGQLHLTIRNLHIWTQSGAAHQTPPPSPSPHGIRSSPAPAASSRSPARPFSVADFASFFRLSSTGGTSGTAVASDILSQWSMTLVTRFVANTQSGAATATASGSGLPLPCVVEQKLSTEQLNLCLSRQQAMTLALLIDTFAPLLRAPQFRGSIPIVPAAAPAAAMAEAAPPQQPLSVVAPALAVPRDFTLLRIVQYSVEVVLGRAAVRMYPDCDSADSIAASDLLKYELEGLNCSAQFDSFSANPTLITVPVEADTTEDWWCTRFVVAVSNSRLLYLPYQTRMATHPLHHIFASHGIFVTFHRIRFPSVVTSGKVHGAPQICQLHAYVQPIEFVAHVLIIRKIIHLLKCIAPPRHHSPFNRAAVSMPRALPPPVPSFAPVSGEYKQSATAEAAASASAPAAAAAAVDSPPIQPIQLWVCVQIEAIRVCMPSVASDPTRVAATPCICLELDRLWMHSAPSSVNPVPYRYPVLAASAASAATPTASRNRPSVSVLSTIQTIVKRNGDFINHHLRASRTPRPVASANATAASSAGSQYHCTACDVLRLKAVAEADVSTAAAAAAPRKADSANANPCQLSLDGGLHSLLLYTGFWRSAAAVSAGAQAPSPAPLSSGALFPGVRFDRQLFSQKMDVVLSVQACYPPFVPAAPFPDLDAELMSTAATITALEAAAAATATVPHVGPVSVGGIDSKRDAPPYLRTGSTSVALSSRAAIPHHSHHENDENGHMEVFVTFSAIQLSLTNSIIQTLLPVIASATAASTSQFAPALPPGTPAFRAANVSGAAPAPSAGPTATAMRFDDSDDESPEADASRSGGPGDDGGSFEDEPRQLKARRKVEIVWSLPKLTLEISEQQTIVKRNPNANANAPVSNTDARLQLSLSDIRFVSTGHARTYYVFSPGTVLPPGSTDGTTRSASPPPAAGSRRTDTTVSTYGQVSVGNLSVKYCVGSEFSQSLFVWFKPPTSAAAGGGSSAGGDNSWLVGKWNAWSMDWEVYSFRLFVPFEALELLIVATRNTALPPQPAVVPSAAVSPVPLTGHHRSASEVNSNRAVALPSSRQQPRFTPSIRTIKLVLHHAWIGLGQSLPPAAPSASGTNAGALVPHVSVEWASAFVRASATHSEQRWHHTILSDPLELRIVDLQCHLAMRKHSERTSPLHVLDATAGVGTYVRVEEENACLCPTTCIIEYVKRVRVESSGEREDIFPDVWALQNSGHRRAFRDVADVEAAMDDAGAGGDNEPDADGSSSFPIADSSPAGAGEDSRRRKVPTFFPFHSATTVNVRLQHLSVVLEPDHIVAAAALMKQFNELGRSLSVAHPNEFASLSPDAAPAASGGDSDESAAVSDVDADVGRRFFQDDFRSMKIDDRKANDRRPRAGHVTFSSNLTPVNSPLVERWMAWRYPSPRALSHITMGAFLSLVAAARQQTRDTSASGVTVTTSAVDSRLHCKLSAWDDVQNAYVAVFEFPIDLRTSSLHTMAHLQRQSGRILVSAEWKLSWYLPSSPAPTAIASSKSAALSWSDVQRQPSASELGQMVRIDSVQYGELSVQWRVGLSLPGRSQVTLVDRNRLSAGASSGDASSGGGVREELLLLYIQNASLNAFAWRSPAPIHHSRPRLMLLTKLEAKSLSLHLHQYKDLTKYPLLFPMPLSATVRINLKPKTVAPTPPPPRRSESQLNLRGESGSSGGALSTPALSMSSFASSSAPDSIDPKAMYLHDSSLVKLHTPLHALGLPPSAIDAAIGLTDSKSAANETSADSTAALSAFLSSAGSDASRRRAGSAAASDHRAPLTAWITPISLCLASDRLTASASPTTASISTSTGTSAGTGGVSSEDVEYALQLQTGRARLNIGKKGVLVLNHVVDALLLRFQTFRNTLRAANTHSRGMQSSGGAGAIKDKHVLNFSLPALPTSLTLPSPPATSGEMKGDAVAAAVAIDDTSERDDGLAGYSTAVYSSAYYILQNRTGLSLRYGQIGTTECRLIAASTDHAYTWSCVSSAVAFPLSAPPPIDFRPPPATALSVPFPTAVGTRFQWMRIGAAGGSDWSHPFPLDVDSVVKGGSASFRSAVIFADSASGVVFTTIFIKIETVGLNTFVTFLPSHVMMNNMPFGLAVDATTISALDASAAVLSASATAATAAATLAGGFGAGAPVRQFNVHTGDSFPLAIWRPVESADATGDAATAKPAALSWQLRIRAGGDAQQFLHLSERQSGGSRSVSPAPTANASTSNPFAGGSSERQVSTEQPNFTDFWEWTIATTLVLADGSNSASRSGDDSQLCVIRHKLDSSQRIACWTQLSDPAGISSDRPITISVWPAAVIRNPLSRPITVWLRNAPVPAVQARVDEKIPGGGSSVLLSDMIAEGVFVRSGCDAPFVSVDPRLPLQLCFALHSDNCNSERDRPAGVSLCTAVPVPSASARGPNNSRSASAVQTIQLLPAASDQPIAISTPAADGNLFMCLTNLHELNARRAYRIAGTALRLCESPLPAAMCAPPPTLAVCFLPMFKIFNYCPHAMVLRSNGIAPSLSTPLIPKLQATASGVARPAPTPVLSPLSRTAMTQVTVPLHRAGGRTGYSACWDNKLTKMFWIGRQQPTESTREPEPDSTVYWSRSFGTTTGDFEFDILTLMDSATPVAAIDRKSPTSGDATSPPPPRAVPDTVLHRYVVSISSERLDDLLAPAAATSTVAAASAVPPSPLASPLASSADSKSGGDTGADKALWALLCTTTVTVKPRFIIHNRSTVPLRIAQLGGMQRSNRLSSAERPGVALISAGEVMALTGWNPNARVPAAAVGDTAAAFYDAKNPDRFAPTIKLSFCSSLAPSSGTAAPAADEKQNTAIPALDDWGWSREIRVSGESGRQNVSIVHRQHSAHRLMSYVVLRHRCVSHVVFFRDPHPPYVLINRTPNSLVLRRLTPRDLTFESAASANADVRPIVDPKVSASTPPLSGHELVVTPFQISEFDWPASSGEGSLLWENEEKIFEHKSANHVAALTVNGYGWSQPILLQPRVVSSPVLATATASASAANAAAPPRAGATSKPSAGTSQQTGADANPWDEMDGLIGAVTEQRRVTLHSIDAKSASSNDGGASRLEYDVHLTTRRGSILVVVSLPSAADTVALPTRRPIVRPSLSLDVVIPELTVCLIDENVAKLAGAKDAARAAAAAVADSASGKASTPRTGAPAATSDGDGTSGLPSIIGAHGEEICNAVLTRIHLHVTQMPDSASPSKPLLHTWSNQPSHAASSIVHASPPLDPFASQRVAAFAGDASSSPRDAWLPAELREDYQRVHFRVGGMQFDNQLNSAAYKVMAFSYDDAPTTAASSPLPTSAAVEFRVLRSLPAVQFDIAQPLRPSLALAPIEVDASSTGDGDTLLSEFFQQNDLLLLAVRLQPLVINVEDGLMTRMAAVLGSLDSDLDLPALRTRLSRAPQSPGGGLGATHSPRHANTALSELASTDRLVRLAEMSETTAELRKESDMEREQIREPNVVAYLTNTTADTHLSIYMERFRRRLRVVPLLAIDDPFFNLMEALVSPRVFLHSLRIHTLDMRINVHAAMGGRAFVGAGEMPVRLSAVNLRSVLCSLDRLGKELAANYLADSLLRSPLLLGSLDLLGNPTFLLRSVGAGVHDLFALPTQALSHGPSAFFRGLGSGVVSFTKHVTEGTLTSMSGFTGSVARNIDALSATDLYSGARQSTRNERPEDVRTGLWSGAKTFGQSVVGGVFGVVTTPFAQARSGGLFSWQFVRGVGSGLLGAVAKPMSGVMDLVAQTSAGWVNSAASAGSGSLSSRYRFQRHREPTPGPNNWRTRVALALFSRLKWQVMAAHWTQDCTISTLATPPVVTTRRQLLVGESERYVDHIIVYPRRAASPAERTAKPNTPTNATAAAISTVAATATAASILVPDRKDALPPPATPAAATAAAPTGNANANTSAAVSSSPVVIIVLTTGGVRVMDDDVLIYAFALAEVEAVTGKHLAAAISEQTAAAAPTAASTLSGSGSGTGTPTRYRRASALTAVGGGDASGSTPPNQNADVLLLMDSRSHAQFALSPPTADATTRNTSRTRLRAFLTALERLRAECLRHRPASSFAVKRTEAKTNSDSKVDVKT